LGNICKIQYIGCVITGYKSLNKLLISIGMFFGSTIGSYIPLLWGGSLFSFTSILFSVMGGLLGIWLGYRTSKYLGFM